MTEKTRKPSTPAPDDLAGNRDETASPGRGPGRQFQKGQSGNPSGRPKDVHGIRELAMSHAPRAIEKLVAIMEHAENEGDQARAAIALLDRACGKPAQSVNSTVTRIDPDSISDAELASYLTDADATEDSGAEAPPKTRRQKKPH